MVLLSPQHSAAAGPTFHAMRKYLFPKGDLTRPLTSAQRRYLAEIIERPGRRYNGRAIRSLEALEQRDLITADYDLVIHHDGSTVWRIQCWPKSAERTSDITAILDTVGIVSPEHPFNTRYQYAARPLPEGDEFRDTIVEVSDESVAGPSRWFRRHVSEVCREWQRRLAKGWEVLS